MSEVGLCNNCGRGFLVAKLMPGSGNGWVTPCCYSSDYDIIGDIMDKKEIGQMESRLYEIRLRVRTVPDDGYVKAAVEDMADFILLMNDRIKALENR